LLFPQFNYCYFELSYSFAGKFKIKTTQCNTKCLENATWKSAIYIELVFTDTSKLHINFIVIIFIYQLKVFNTCFIYPSIEIKNESLNLLVPFWWFIEKEHNFISFVISKFPLDCFFFNFII